MNGAVPGLRRYRAVTAPLPRRYRAVTTPLPRRYHAVTTPLQCGYHAVTTRLPCGHHAVTTRLPRGYLVVLEARPKRLVARRLLVAFELLHALLQQPQAHAANRHAQHHAAAGGGRDDEENSTPSALRWCSGRREPMDGAAGEGNLEGNLAIATRHTYCLRRAHVIAPEGDHHARLVLREDKRFLDERHLHQSGTPRRRKVWRCVSARVGAWRRVAARSGAWWRVAARGGACRRAARRLLLRLARRGRFRKTCCAERM